MAYNPVPRLKASTISSGTTGSLGFTAVAVSAGSLTDTTLSVVDSESSSTTPIVVTKDSGQLFVEFDSIAVGPSSDIVVYRLR